MKLRPLEIERGKNNQYVIKVDGEKAKATWNRATVIESKEYHGIDINAEVISMIIRELDSEFNLSEHERQEYERTLRYILED